MELDILHKSSGEYIVEFYGAFFIESCVYYCMEYMDAGSLDKLYGEGVPEDVLAKIATSVKYTKTDVYSCMLNPK
jgi:mitogen-activated protein kinase kinase